MKLRRERGVAMVTVLFVGAALTSVASVAAFTTIREFQAGRDDHRAAAAHAFAEAGIDRFIDHLKGGSVSYNDMYSAGCDGRPPLNLPVTVNKLGRGSFSASLQVFNPNGATAADRFPPASCAARPKDAHNPLYLVITSQGTHPAAKRVLQQVIKVGASGLPIGHYATRIDAGGTPSLQGVSFIAETTLTGRNFLKFRGTDPYYTYGDFYPDAPESFWAAQGLSSTDFIPSAAHAAGSIFLKSNSTDPEFPLGAPKNCTANGTTGEGAGQSLWDGDASPGSGTITSSCTGQNGKYPPTSKFTDANLARVAPKKLDEQDHQYLKQAAQKNGIYCDETARTCTIMGQPIVRPAQWNDGDIASLFAAGTRSFIAYFEFTAGSELVNSVTWKANVWGCNDDRQLHRSAVIIVRRGGISVESSMKLNGAVVVDGVFKYAGGPTINGTILAQEIKMSGGATFTLDPCWVRNMPSAFLGYQPTHWSEIDR